VVLQLVIEPFAIELDLLSISVNMVPIILCQVVKLLSVVIHRMVPLAQLQELDKLAVHSARWQVVTTECDTKLIPCHVVVCKQCCSKQHPPGP
jgi:hypothetical protein